ncbi:A-kinase anchor protein 10, mitochondrial isoform X2 [Eurytemora carolleeae]|uniref:A-kinase anchor protein 10, mitochondrial isoform X2 n=1 Tax=Eurytemora carolleeae TaxID=1294199 RepID=UPI000C7874F4|nr:A-kinase anchor protein 10, mitochondrial isoform X2 [Eurytemora carolleeae]|eukprot:XP_023340768.1 A-kinase anchor protein 10, mitochondrial-like isoform X2 [Eurytemora affinis]
MAFWRRVKNKNSGGNVSKSQSCPGFESDDLRNISYTEKREPLADFSTEYEEKWKEGDNKDLTDIKFSRLSPPLQELLNDPSALGYFIQYLDTRSAGHLVKFYLDTQSFRNSADFVRSSPRHCSRGIDEERGRLERVPENSSLESSSQPSSSAPSPSSSSSLHNIASESESFDSGFSKEFESGRESGHPNTPSCTCSSSCTCSASCTGACTPEGSCTGSCSSIGGSVASFPSSNQSSNHQSGGLESEEYGRKESILKSRTEDALNIYRRYIAPDSATSICIPTEMTRDIVELICDETGFVDPDCFLHAQDEVLCVLESEHYPGFQESEYQAKHQLDVLTGGKLVITDLLYNDVALFHLMEFMEAEGQRAVVEFWMSAHNFQQSIASNDDESSGETTHDAMILYDKYFSMQASNPLGFDDSIRLEIENNICQDTGPGIHCFSRALRILLAYIETKYLTKFLASTLFQSYVKELISSIQNCSKPSIQSPVKTNITTITTTTTTMRGHNNLNRCNSSESISSCNSESSSRLSHLGVQRNTLLATGDKLSPVERFGSLRIDNGALTDPDSIWKRKPIKSKVGKIDYLGRYHSSWEKPPDILKEGGLIGKVRRLGRGNEQIRLQEEMAWQVAEMFVRDVTSITMGGDNNNGELETQEKDPGHKISSDREYSTEPVKDTQYIPVPSDTETPDAKTRYIPELVPNTENSVHLSINYSMHNSDKYKMCFYLLSNST